MTEDLGQAPNAYKSHHNNFYPSRNLQYVIWSALYDNIVDTISM